MEQNRVLSLEGGYVEIADSEKLNDMGSQVTVEAWVKVMEFTNQYMPVIYKGDTRGPDLPNISFACLVRRDGAICLNAPPRGQSMHILHSPHGLIDLNTWFHLAGVVDGKNRTMSLFFNGAEVARASFDGNLLRQSTLPLRMGWTHEKDSLSDSPFAGQIDEVRIWNVARTQEQIQSVMYSGLSGDEPGLVGYWPFDDEMNIATDSSPEHSDGKLVGEACFVEAELPQQGEMLVPAVLSGKVLDEKGQPRRVWYRLKCDGEEIESRRTNASGEYRIVIPHPGEGSYDLYAGIGELGDMRLDIRLHRGISLDIDLTLREPVKMIQGKLLMLDDETPHMAVAIQVMQDDEVVETAFSDDKGEYWFVNLKPGEYQVRCHVLGGCIYYGEDQSKSGKPISLHVESGKTISDVDFRFMPFKKGTWRAYGSSDGLTSMYVHGIHQDREGMLWFSSCSHNWRGGSGVSRYDGKEFVTFTTEDGLVSNAVWTIHTAADGALWFGTREGVSRYDGKRFTNFTTENGLIHNDVTAIDSDSDGAIWFGTLGGVSRYDGEKFTNFTTRDGLLSNHVNTIYCDPDGAVWIGMVGGGGVSRYDGVGFTRFTRKDGLLSDSVSSIHRDNDGMMWFGTFDHGAFRYDGVEFVHFSVRDGLMDHSVRAINSTPDGTLWFGTRSGVSRYDGKSFVNFSGREELSTSPPGGIDDILVSRDGSLWFATGVDGVFRYDEQSFSTLTASHGLPAGVIQAICRAPDDTLWVGAGEGLARYTGSRHNPVLTTYTREDGVVPYPVSAIHPSPDGTLWFGTGGYYLSAGQGIYYYDPEDDSSAPFVNLTVSDGLVHRHINGIISEPDGAIWITTSGGISRYDGRGMGDCPHFVNFTAADGLASNGVLRAHRSADGILWFGTNNGFSRYDGKDFTNFTAEDGLGHNDAWSIDSDTDGNIWIAKFGGGLSRYDGSEFINYTHRDGLASNWILDIYRDAEGLIWLTTYGGVSGYDGTAWTILDTWDGLGHNKVISVSPDSDGSLWFATFKGATNYRRSKVKPGVQIVSVTTDKTYSDLSSVPAFIVGTRVTIQYNAIDFKTHPDRRQYRCQITESDASRVTRNGNMDSGWGSPTKATSFDWIPEEAGTYTFAVQSIDRDLNYSQPATLSLTVQPDPKLVAMQMELDDLRQIAGHKYHFSSIIGESAAIRQVHALMERAIDSGLTVLITGETGTGKELVARAIHHNSPRKDKPILDRNCGAIPSELLTSELFGHRKGAFTGANEDKMGLFEAASGGTVQLDEIGEMPKDAQVHLLRFLEEREVQRLGENISRHVDVRIIATTNRDLAEEVTADRFREDLYYRLSEFPIRIPPLRERPEDIPLLAEHFLRDMDKDLDGFAPGVIEMLQSYSWPGNVRELRNVIRRAAALAEEGKQIQTYHFPPSITQGESLMQEAIQAVGREPLRYRERVNQFERRCIEHALRTCNGNRTQAAKMLGIDRSQLYEKMKFLGIHIPANASTQPKDK